MGKLTGFNYDFNGRKNVFHLSEFSAKSENPNWEGLIQLQLFFTNDGPILTSEFK